MMENDSSQEELRVKNSYNKKSKRHENQKIFPVSIVQFVLWC